MAGYSDRFTLLNNDLLAYIFWSNEDANSRPSPTLRFQNLRDPGATPAPIENVWSYRVSPDQRFIALTQIDDVNTAFASSRLSVIPVEGGPPIWESAGASSPNWVPDGRQFIYAEFDSSGQWVAFRSVDLDSGESREFINRNLLSPPLEATYAEAVWSPTGEWLAMVTGGQPSNNQIWLVGPDGSEPRLMVVSQDYIGPPRFSADGQFLAAIVYAPNSNGQLQIINVPTGEIVVQTIASLNAYDWSPTGHQLALAKYDGLYRLTDPAAEPQRLNNNACYSVAWNPTR